MYIHRMAKDLGRRERRGGGERERRGGEGEQRERRGVKGAKGSEAYSILGFRVPTTWNEKTSITTYSGEVSPPPENRTITQCTFTEPQKAVRRSPPRAQNFGGKNSQSTTKVTLTSHQSCCMNLPRLPLPM